MRELGTCCGQTAPWREQEWMHDSFVRCHFTSFTVLGLVDAQIRPPAPCLFTSSVCAPLFPRARRSRFLHDATPPRLATPLRLAARPRSFLLFGARPPCVAIMGRAATGKAVKPPTADKMAERLDRAASERMFFMGRVSEGTGILQPFVVTGLSGKVYTINLSTEESAASDAGSVGIGAKCNCPDFIFRRVRGHEPPRVVPSLPFFCPSFG